MPEIRKDPVSDTHVIMAPERRKRPTNFRIVTDDDAQSTQNCPFCPGNEAMTPPEVRSVRTSGAANSPGWSIRVIPNKFPALRVEGEIERSAEFLYDRINGIGAHEVIIDTAVHGELFAALDNKQLQQLLSVFRERIVDLKRDFRLKYILIFKNSGPLAGATLAHSHTQLIALPKIPARITQELAAAQDHYQRHERCIFCDIIRYESEFGKRVLLENAHFIALAPYASRFPYELAIYPKRHSLMMEAMGNEETEALAKLLKDMLGRINRALNEPNFNLVIHNGPFMDGIADVFHWHIEFTPMLGKTAGFEWGSGYFINPVLPEEAIKTLRAFKA